MASVVINPDKTISIDGNKTFLVNMSTIATDTWPAVPGETTSQSVAKNSNALINYALATREFIVSNIIPTHNPVGILFPFDIGTGITPEIQNNKGMFAYLQWDEPTAGNGRYAGMTEAQMLASLLDSYNSHHTSDSAHPVILNHWHDGWRWVPYCDILSWDIYTIKSGQGWTRQDAIYAWEIVSNQAYLQGTEVPSFSKPMMTWIQANGVEQSWADYIPTIDEIRAIAYCAICIGIQGVGFFGYQHGASQLYLNPTLTAQVNSLMGELRSLNDILVKPTLDYGWTYHPGSRVTFSNIYSKTVNLQATSNFDWILKQNLLIVVNKDASPITTTITVQGIAPFTDTFAGLAVHTYQLSGTPPPPSSLPWKCSGAPNYVCTQDSAGTYNTQAECQAACQASPPPPPPSDEGLSKLFMIMGGTIIIKELIKK